MKCPDCDKEIIRIERYKTTVVWEKEGEKWHSGHIDSGTHFHLFCPDYDEYSRSQKHTTKRWGNELPDELASVVYPGSKKKEG